MLRIVSVLMLALIMVASTAEARSGHVKGYLRSNGTYVAPHQRSTPDSSRFNNYSSKGSVNPYTGKKGSKDPFKVSPPSIHRR